MSYTKERLIGLKVYDATAAYVGQVQDIAFTVGEETLSLLVAKDGKEREKQGQTVAWRTVQAVGDIIILKKPEPEKTQQPQQEQKPPACPSCGQPLRWIQQYQRWFCDKEKKYA